MHYYCEEGPIKEVQERMCVLIAKAMPDQGKTTEALKRHPEMLDVRHHPGLSYPSMYPGPPM